MNFSNDSFIKFGSGFNYTTKVPVDKRSVVAQVSDLIAMNNAYRGIVVYVEEDNSLYKLDADDFSTGSNWHKVSSVANGLEYQGTVTTATLPDNLAAADKGKLYYNSTIAS